MLHECSVFVQQLHLYITQILPVGHQLSTVGRGFQSHGIACRTYFMHSHRIRPVDTLGHERPAPIRQTPRYRMVRVICRPAYAHLVAVVEQSHTLAVSRSVHFDDQTFVSAGEIPYRPHVRPLPKVAPVVDVERIVAHGDTHHRFVVPHRPMESRARLFHHANVEKSRRPTVARPTGFTDVVRTGPKKTACDKIVLGNDVPRIVRVVTTDIPFRSAVIRQFFRHQEATLGKFLMVGKHTCLQIIVAHDVGHSGKLLVMAVLCREANLPRRFELVHEVLQHSRPSASRIRPVPRFLQFIADAP